MWCCIRCPAGEAPDWRSSQLMSARRGIFRHSSRQPSSLAANVWGACDSRTERDAQSASCMPRPCNVDALPDMGPRGGGIVFLYDMEEATALPAECLTQLFGLTPAEAGLALEVVRGGSSESMACRLGISVNTVNTHLRRIFDKTSTHRQADLLKLLLALSMVQLADGWLTIRSARLGEEALSRMTALQRMETECWNVAVAAP